VLAVHFFGHPVDMDPLLELARERNLVVVEDAAEAHGAEYLGDRGGRDPRWRRLGSFGTASTFSFYANKPVTTGEGGMVLTDDDRLADRLRSLRNLGFGRTERFRHEAIGWNYRLTNLQAALGVAQVARLDAVVAAKRHLAARYEARLRGLPLELPRERDWARGIFWMYGVVLRDQVPFGAVELGARLDRVGIETRPYFLGMHEQPALHRLGLFVGERYPVAERLSRRGLYLPSSPTLDDASLDRIASAVTAALS
jgi:perosamine synthetase